jgi:hypothetical protein
MYLVFMFFFAIYIFGIKIPQYEDVFNEYEWATRIKLKFKLDA